MSNLPGYMAKLDYLVFNCAECGAEKYKHCDDWGWKHGGLLFCSWHCLRAYERKLEARKRPAQKVLDQLPAVAKHLTGEEKTEALELLKSGMLQRDVALRMGCSMSQIGHMARMAGIIRRNTPIKPIEPERVEQMRDLYRSGVSISTIAKLVHVGRSTVVKYTMDIRR